jgi:hypothetical protein
MKVITRKAPYNAGPEEAEQIKFFDFCRAMEHTHPAYRLAWHVPNERKASIIRRAKMKLAGVKKGVPDITIPVPNDKYAALYIEMKVKPNKPSPEQINMLKDLNAQGNYAAICWSADEAIELIQKYVANRL